MKVSKITGEFIEEVVFPAVVSNCIKRDAHAIGDVKEAIWRVFKFINTLNEEIKPYQTVFRGMSINDILMPSGLAQFLYPRVVSFDVTNKLHHNMIRMEHCNKDELSDEGYTYYDFLKDLTLIRTSMRISNSELNTSVAQAVKDVDLFTILDRVAFEDRNRLAKVKWNGQIGTEFVPIYLLHDFQIGMSKDEYDVDPHLMLQSMFDSRCKDLFTK